MTDRPTLLISYSHKDEEHKDFVVSHLRVAERQGVYDVWDDRRIKGGGDWQVEIDAALAKADIAVLLISRHFLTSDFIMDHEVRTMLQRHASEDAILYPILISACTWQHVDWLKSLNVRPTDGTPLNSFDEAECDRVMTDMASEVTEMLHPVEGRTAIRPKAALGPTAAGPHVSGGNDRFSQVIASFEDLFAASEKATAGNNPAAKRIRDNLADCLDDLRCSEGDFEIFKTLPSHLAGLNRDIDEHLLGRYFEAMPAAGVLHKLEALTAVAGNAGKHRVNTMECQDLVAALKVAIGQALHELPSAGLERNITEACDRELRHLRREVGKPSYDAAVVNERRKCLEGLKVNLLERTKLLTEALLAEGFPNLPTGTVLRYVPEIWCPQLVMIPTGTFLMGSPDSEGGRDREEEGPQHEVTISKPFALGRYAVTFDEYDHFCGMADRDKPDDVAWGRGRRPVINVKHDDAEAYCVWLGEVAGASIRLPLEAEWEYACRAGTTTRYAFGDQFSHRMAHADVASIDSVQNVDEIVDIDSIGLTAEVGNYPPNYFGLFDMHGNVKEWCADRWHKSYKDSSISECDWDDGQGWLRVARGGGWRSPAEDVRSAYRYGGGPGCAADLGFRCACVQGS